MKEIRRFRDEYAFLSNFFECDIEYHGIHYNTAEAAFQAQKCKDPQEQLKISNMPPLKAKRYGRTVQLIPGWHEKKLDIMHSVVFKKFIQNEILRKKLTATGDAEIVEGNSWHDRYWGADSKGGENHLGKILMQVRKGLRD